MADCKFLTSLCLAFFFTVIGAFPALAQKEKDKKNQLIPVAPAPRTAYSDVRRDNLLNGLQIITLERADDAVLKCDLIVRAGSMFDLSDKTGLAHMTQATLMAVNPRIKEEFDSLNAKIDWGVNHDYTWFHIESPLNSFDAAMEIFARLLIAENIRPDAFKLAQDNALTQLKASQPTSAERADEAFHKALYGTHPYGHNLVGDVKAVSGMKQGDLYDFVKRFYVSNNAFAVVTGNVKHERIMRTFKTFFGGWTKSALVPATFRPPQRVAQLNLVKIESDAPTVELRGGVVGVRMADPDFIASQLLGHVLSTRLAAAGINAIKVKNAPQKLAGPFYLAGSVPAEQAQAVSRQATDIFAALAAQEIKAEELAAAKGAVSAAIAAHPIDQFLRDIEIYELSKNYPLDLGKQVEQLAAADLQRVAKRLLTANALTVVALGRAN